jgi:hypothetical protein
MLSKDVLLHKLPVFIDDIPTLRAYVKAIGVSRVAMERWRHRHTKRITDVNDKYELVFDALLNGVPHGNFTYVFGDRRIEGQYNNGVPFGRFTMTMMKSDGSDLLFKEIFYVNGVKSRVVSCIMNREITYIDGKKGYMRQYNNSGVTLTYSGNHPDIKVSKCVGDNDDESHIVVDHSGKKYTYVLVDGRFDRLLLDGRELTGMECDSTYVCYAYYYNEMLVELCE